MEQRVLLHRVVITFIAVGSTWLFYEIIRSARRSATSRAPETEKVSFRITVGGMVGIVVALSIFWLILYVRGPTPASPSPYLKDLPYLSSLPVGGLGFALGSMVALLSGKWRK